MITFIGEIKDGYIIGRGAMDQKVPWICDKVFFVHEREINLCDYLAGYSWRHGGGGTFN